MVMEVKVNGELESNFAAFGDIASKLADKTIRLVAYRYKQFIRSSYLSGQTLSKGSGTLSKSITVGRKKIGQGKMGYQSFIYWVGPKRIAYSGRMPGHYTDTMMVSRIMEKAGGYTIAPKERMTHKNLNRSALAFTISGGSIVFAKKVEVTQARPFMSQSVKAFPWAQKFEEMTESVIRSELKKLEKEGKYVPGGLD